MRVNVYAEELPKVRRVQSVRTKADTGQKFSGTRIFLESSDKLHDTEHDDRSAITFWGPPEQVACLLREAADAIFGGKWGE